MCVYVYGLCTSVDWFGFSMKWHTGTTTIKATSSGEPCEDYTSMCTHVQLTI